MSTIQKIVKNADLWFSKFVIFTSEAKIHGPLEKLKFNRKLAFSAFSVHPTQKSQGWAAQKSA